jgi:SRSO17 transposase
MGCPRGWSSVIEASFQRGKGEAGMDEYEVRTWQGWHHHIALSLIAV